MKKNLTIPEIEDALDKLIREKAKSLNLSLEKTIRTLLKDSLGVEVPSKTAEKRRKEFIDLSGAWTVLDLEEFTLASLDLSGIQVQDSE